jgi:hypothetical protein
MGQGLEEVSRNMPPVEIPQGTINPADHQVEATRAANLRDIQQGHCTQASSDSTRDHFRLQLAQAEWKKMFNSVEGTSQRGIT